MLGDSDGGPGEGAGIGGGILAMQAEGAVAPPAALVEAGQITPESLPLDPRYLGLEHQVPDVLGPSVSDQGRLRQVFPGINIPRQQRPVSLPQDTRHPR